MDFNCFSSLTLLQAPRPASQTAQENLYKNKHSTRTKNCVFLVRFLVFWFPAARDRTKSQNTTPEPPSEASRDPPGTLKSINFAPLRGPGVQPTICFGSPGRPQAPFGALLAATLGPHGAQKRPGSFEELIWCSPGTFGEHFWLHF